MLNNSEVEETVELFEITPVLIFTLTLFYFLVSFTAIVGNSMILWIVYRSESMKRVTNYFIANISASDLLIGAFAIPFQFQAALLQKWILPDFMCSFCPTIQVISLNVSIFTLVVLSWDRYQAVCYPLKPKTSRSRVKCLIVVIWIVSIVLSVPTTIAFRVEHVYDENSGQFTKAFCNVIGLNESIWRTYSYTLVGLQYCFPLSFISFAYLRMGITLFSRDLPGDDSAVGNVAQSLRRKRKVIKMLLIVIVLFALCWLPFQCYNVISEIFPSVNSYKYINIIWFACHWLAMSNSCYNPLIYYIYSENFNNEFKRRFGFLFGNVCKQPSLQRRPTESMNTLPHYSTVIYSERSNSSKLPHKCRVMLNRPNSHQNHNNTSPDHMNYATDNQINIDCNLRSASMNLCNNQNDVGVDIHTYDDAVRE